MLWLRWNEKKKRTFPRLLKMGTGIKKVSDMVLVIFIPMLTETIGSHNNIYLQVCKDKFFINHHTRDLKPKSIRKSRNDGKRN